MCNTSKISYENSNLKGGNVCWVQNPKSCSSDISSFPAVYKAQIDDAHCIFFLIFVLYKMNRITKGTSMPHLGSVSSKMKIATSVVGLLILLEGKLG